MLSRLSKSSAGMILALLFILVFSSCGTTLRYSQGKDSHEAFGDGEYQLLRDPNGDLHLWNCDINCGILYTVRSYQANENQVYFSGKSPIDLKKDYGELYAIIDLKTNAVRLIVDESSASEEQIDQIKRYTVSYLSGKSIRVMGLSQLNDEEKSILLSLSKKAHWSTY